MLRFNSNLQKNQPDIICLQEAYGRGDEILKFSKELGYPFHHRRTGGYKIHTRCTRRSSSTRRYIRRKCTGCVICTLSRHTVAILSKLPLTLIE